MEEMSVDTVHYYQQSLSKMVSLSINLIALATTMTHLKPDAKLDITLRLTPLNVNVNFIYSCKINVLVCHKDCYACYGPTNETCLRCPLNRVALDGKCVKSCPIGYSVEYGRCQKCPIGYKQCGFYIECVKG